MIQDIIAYDWRPKALNFADCIAQNTKSYLRGSLNRNFRKCEMDLKVVPKYDNVTIKLFIRDPLLSLVRDQNMTDVVNCKPGRW